MGMFDYVAIAIKCPKCGSRVQGFQTKSSPCMMDTLKYWETDNFYDSCDKCGIWIEFDLKHRPIVPLEAYEAVYKDKKKGTLIKFQAEQITIKREKGE